MATTPEERREQIGDASAQYLIHRWGSLRPGLGALLLAMAGVALLLLAIGVGRSGWHDAKAWQSVLLFAASACFTGHLWMLRHRLRDPVGSLRTRSVQMQQEAGVVVEEPAVRAVPWWYWPLAFGLVPAYFLGVLSLSLGAPARFQPLVLAGGLTLLGLAFRAVMDRRARSRFRPVSFVGWALYCAYALAVAAGLPQPLAALSASSRAFAWLLRTTAAFVAIGLVQVIVSEWYSRQQFRRLQRLVKESAPAEGDHGAD